MTSDKLHGIIHTLRKDRPLFHSEADFQHALAWAIHKNHPDFEVRLEKREALKGKEIYFDICVISLDNIIPVEVKYKTSALQRTITSRWYVEEYLLKHQAAHDISRYDFIKDIARIEEFDKGGFAVFLTNDKLYWEESGYAGFDDEFKIHEGRELHGKLRWKAGTGPGTMKGRKEAIKLKGKYTLHWEEYSELKSESFPQQYNTTFKYLLLEVQKETSY